MKSTFLSFVPFHRRFSTSWTKCISPPLIQKLITLYLVMNRNNTKPACCLGFFLSYRISFDNAWFFPHRFIHFFSSFVNSVWVGEWVSFGFHQPLPPYSFTPPLSASLLPSFVQLESNPSFHLSAIRASSNPRPEHRGCYNCPSSQWSS